MTAETTIPDIERCALAILARDSVNAHHPVLRAWIEALANDPNERRYIDEFPIPAEWANIADEDRSWIMPEPGVYGREHLSSLIYEHAWFKRDHPSAPRRRHFVAIAAEALMRLGYAVYQFRQDGRPSGDVSHDLMGLGGPLLVITSSLAAAVAEYDNHMQNAWAMDGKDDLDEATDRVSALLQRLASPDQIAALFVEYGGHHDVTSHVDTVRLAGLVASFVVDGLGRG